MRFLVGIILLLLVQKDVFAQPAQSAPKETKTLEQKTIDNLNDLAFDIYLGSPDSARKVAEKALLLAEHSKYKAGIGRSFLNIGHVYWSQSYYPIALFYLNKALANLPQDQTRLIADCYNVTGRTYAELGNFKAAFNNLAMAGKYAGKDVILQGEMHSELSFIYLLLQNYDQAAIEVKKGLALNGKAKNLKGIAILYGRLGDIYRFEKNYPAALAYSDTAHQMSLKIKNNRLRSKIYITYAMTYIGLRDYNKAIVYAQKGAALADSIGVLDALSSAYHTLNTVYEQQGDLKQAMAYQKAYNDILERQKKFDKVKNTELIQDYFALDSRLDSIQTAERNSQEDKIKMQQQRQIIILLAMSLLIVLALLSVTYYYYKQKMMLNTKLHKQHDALLKQKQLIEAQTANLEVANKIKDKLLAVIGHDLRTPISNLRNIAEMFELGYLTVNEIQMLMKDVSAHVKGAELTLANLMDWAGSNIKGRNINSSRLDIFLLGVEMEQTFNHALQRKNIEFLNQANPGQSVLADENHIKVVLRNLISNAIKFTDINGCIKLNSEYEENKVIISVEDNGKGMSAEEIGMLFYLQTHFTQPGTLGENGTGIGLLLCKELVELNGGKLWITSSPGKGSKFCFSLPLNAEYA